MKLKDFMGMPLEDALSQFDMVDSKIHTNDEGEVIVVELKYKDPEYKETKPSVPTPRRS